MSGGVMVALNLGSGLSFLLRSLTRASPGPTPPTKSSSFKVKPSWVQASALGPILWVALFHGVRGVTVMLLPATVTVWLGPITAQLAAATGAAASASAPSAARRVFFILILLQPASPSSSRRRRPVSLRDNP